MCFIAFLAVPPVPRPTTTRAWSSNPCINAKYASVSNNQEKPEILTKEEGMSERTGKGKQVFSRESQNKCLELGDNYFHVGCACPRAQRQERRTGRLGTLFFVAVLRKWRARDNELLRFPQSQLGSNRLWKEDTTSENLKYWPAAYSEHKHNIFKKTSATSWALCNTAAQGSLPSDRQDHTPVWSRSQQELEMPGSSIFNDKVCYASTAAVPAWASLSHLVIVLAKADGRRGEDHANHISFFCLKRLEIGVELLLNGLLLFAL